MANPKSVLKLKEEANIIDIDVNMMQMFPGLSQCMGRAIKLSSKISFYIESKRWAEVVTLLYKLDKWVLETPEIIEFQKKCDPAEHGSTQQLIRKIHALEEEIDKRMNWEDEEKCRERQMNEPQKKSLKIRLKSLSRLQSLRKNQE